MAYSFAVLDPRNIPAAVEANDKVFAEAVGEFGMVNDLLAISSIKKLYSFYVYLVREMELSENGLGWN